MAQDCLRSGAFCEKTQNLFPVVFLDLALYGKVQLLQFFLRFVVGVPHLALFRFQWDATSNVMEDWMYNDYAEKYAFDPKVQQWMKKVNPWALQNIAETLLEAEQRQMWNADDETKEKLQELYLSVEGEIEEDDEE